MAVGVTGCSSIGAPADGTTRYTSYVGDRNTVVLGSTVAPVSVSPGDTPYMNLNVTLSMFINPKETTILSDTDDVERIARRNAPRILAYVVEVMAAAHVTEQADIVALRRQIADTANATFASIFKQWSEADKYSVDIVVTGLYLTTPDTTQTSTGGCWRW